MNRRTLVTIAVLLAGGVCIWFGRRGIFGLDRKAEPGPLPSSPVLVASFPDPPANVPLHPEPYVPRPRGTITFNEQIASIVYAKCGGCHREGEAAPFPLLTFAEVSARSDQILDVIQSGYMPPWPPADGYGNFAAPRKLSVDQRGMFAQWIAEGCAEGTQPPPPRPEWTKGWKMGPPDLVLQMPERYPLQAEGTDVFRNFVLPIPIDQRRYVVGFEFRVSAPTAVHHARMFLDKTPASRQRDARDPGPGFSNLLEGVVEDPAGHWLGWTPGKQPTMLPAGIAWQLDPGTDLVIELHMLPSGKQETVQISMGLYFNDSPPTRIPQVIRLGPRFMDIPAGEKNHVVRDAYRLPVAATIRSVYAHAHYLGKRIEGYAVLPDGSKKWLLRIDHWDFNWQDEYRYADPIAVPKGTQLVMQFTYDNSSDNFRNPHVPPQRVFYGLESFSEMAELWLQVLPQDRAAGAVLEKDYVRREEDMQIDGYRQEILARPERAEPRFRLAALLAARQQTDEAIKFYQEGFQMDPRNSVARNNFGVLMAQLGKIAEAREQFRRAVEEIGRASCRERV